MITRLRVRAGVYVSAMLMLVGAALAARAQQQATVESVTRSEMYATLGACGVVIFGAFWVLLSSQTKRISDGIDRLDATVSKFYDSLAAHDRNPYAHGEASDHNHAPMDAQIAAVKKELEDFVGWCHENRCPQSPRDPMRSPNVRRSSDPEGFDGRPERGRG